MTLAEGVQLVTFGILVAMTIGGALGVVLLENIVYSAFLLGIVFVSIAGLYILLNAGFVAAAQVLVYVGAVNVLILFGIMLVNKRQPFDPMKGAWLGRVCDRRGMCRFVRPADGIGAEYALGAVYRSCGGRYGYRRNWQALFHRLLAAV